MRVIDRVLKVRQHHCAGPERPRYGVASWGKCSHSSSPSGAHDERIEVDPALDALRDRLAEIIASPPENTDELVTALSGLAKLSNQWSEAIQALRAPTRRLVGPAAAASVSVAARRAEESFIELEI